MQGIERAYCDACIRALLMANQTLMHESIVNAASREKKYGKGDTLALDAIPEIAIAAFLKNFDRRAVLITEELGGQLAGRMGASAGESPTLFFCDPTDRSSYFRTFLQKLQGDNPVQRVGAVVGSEQAITAWEAEYRAPATITGATSAVTCVREGLPVFSVILNYVTQELLLVCGAGVKIVPLSPYGDTEYERMNTEAILRFGKVVTFSPLAGRVANYEQCMSFVTFLGKEIYPDNFLDCSIFSQAGEMRQPIYDLPGGPTRTLYLSDAFNGQAVGFILANGEKIVEWIHWLSAARFAKCNGESVLQLFEVTHDRPWTKEGISMAPSPAYSIFRVNDDGFAHIDIRPFCAMTRPSQFRATLVLAPSDNYWLHHVMERCRYREIVFVG